VFGGRSKDGFFPGSIFAIVMKQDYNSMIMSQVKTSGIAPFGRINHSLSLLQKRIRNSLFR